GAGILASVAAGGAWFSNRHGAVAPASPLTVTSPAAAAKSIAVMPLVNISRDSSDAYFAAGMTAELTNALSRIPGLRVASGSDAAVKEQAGNPTDFGKSMNVTMVLVGTVQRD